jgi:hypothetical protein
LRVAIDAGLIGSQAYAFQRTIGGALPFVCHDRERISAMRIGYSLRRISKTRDHIRSQPILDINLFVNRAGGRDWFTPRRFFIDCLARFGRGRGDLADCVVHFILLWLIGIIADGISLVLFGTMASIVSVLIGYFVQIVGGSSILGQYGVSERAFSYRYPCKIVVETESQLDGVLLCAVLPRAPDRLERTDIAPRIGSSTRSARECGRIVLYRWTMRLP